jgi:polyhydroxyalkanoate synthesis regulator phasin
MLTMTRRRKLTFAAGAAGAVLLVAGLGAAGAIAASRIISPGEETKAIIDDAASQLGVEPSELSEALKEALKNRIDEAVDDGRLTEEQADELKQRIDENEYPLLGGPWRFGLDRHGAGLDRFGPLGHLGDFRLLSTAASYLGMTEAELRAALEDKTLAEVAKEHGKTAAGLVQQLVATQTKRIDEAVADGKLTDDQATTLKAGLEERMESFVNGELRWRMDGDRHRFWPGSGSPRAPPLSPFGGPSA